MKQVHGHDARCQADALVLQSGPVLEGGLIGRAPNKQRLGRQSHFVARLMIESCLARGTRYPAALRFIVPCCCRPGFAADAPWHAHMNEILRLGSFRFEFSVVVRTHHLP